MGANLELLARRPLCRGQQLIAKNVCYCFWYNVVKQECALVNCCESAHKMILARLPI